MKRPTKGILFIVSGIILAVVVGFVANSMVSKAMEETTVVVAKHTIKPFTQVSPDDLKTVNKPSAGVPEEVATSFQAVVGNYTTTTIVEGNPIQKEHLALKGKGDLSSVLTNFHQPSIRAFALPTQNPMINQITSGNRVDLHAIYEKDDKKSSVLIADSVLVLGIAETSDGPVGLTLALTQEQVKEIAPVMNNIQVSLVPFNAKGDTKVNGTDESQSDNKPVDEQDKKHKEDTEGGNDTSDGDSDKNKESNGD